jgi:ATP-binding cassette subfamily F protein 3
LKQALAEYNGTLLVVSHDREFLSGLTDRTIEFRDGHLKEYLGDVNYFLEKRQVDNLREIEKRSTINNQPATQSSTANGQTSSISPEEKKQLERAVQKQEKRIAELEAEVGKWDLKLAEPDFYTKPGANNELKKYSDLKAELTKVYGEWEAAVEKLG